MYFSHSEMKLCYFEKFAWQREIVNMTHQIAFK